MRRILLATLLAGLLAAPAADAATVTSSATTFHDLGGKGFPETWITTRTIDVVAVPGEGNRITVRLAPGAVIVEDPGTPLGAGTGCAAAPGGAVTCPVSDAQQLALKALLGDRDDTLAATVPGMRATVDAGPGADVVEAAAGGVVDGGEGDDELALGAYGTLLGGPGADTLTGSGEYDTLNGGTGTDALDGRAGGDVLSYAGRSDAVVVDLAAPMAGAPGEQDKIAGLEAAVGGEGPDVLRAPPGVAAALTGGGGDDVLEGSAADDRLDGGAGADRISAGAGKDWLEGGPGDDQLDGGDGNDGIVARDGADVAHGGRGADEISDLGDDGGARDVYTGDGGDDSLVGATVDGGPGDDELYGGVMRGGPGADRLDGPRTAAAARDVDCGPGRDTLLQPSDRVVAPAGCERVEPWLFGGKTIRVPPRIEGRRVTIRMPNGCLYAYEQARCRVKAALFLDGRHVGTEQARWRRERAGARALRFVLPRRPRPGAVLWLRLVKYETDEPDERGGYSVRLRWRPVRR